jgi:hypothetical protein
MPEDSSLPCRNVVDFLNDSPLLDQLARTSGFLRRQARKLTPGGFVKAIVLATAHARVSFDGIALHTGHTEPEACSRQNIHQRCDSSAVDFMRAVVNHAIAQRCPALAAPATAAAFNRIVIEDGSVIRFHDSACEDFPAFSGTAGNKAMLRLQFAYDFKSGRTLLAAPGAYSHTDTAAAGELLDELKPGDLCLRDMGYYKAELLQRMDEMGIFYMSRLKSEVKIPRGDGGPAMGLDEFLRGLGGATFDGKIRVGAVRGFTTRLVAARVPSEVAAQRRRKLHAEARRTRRPASALKLALADWMIFVTNIPPEVAGPGELRKLYGLRWHVELVFKALKSQGCVRALAAHASNKHHLKALLLGQLLQIFLNLRLWRLLSPASKGSPRLSLLKMAAMTRETLRALWPAISCPECWDKHLRTLLYRCRYDKRKRRNIDEIWEEGLG